MANRRRKQGNNIPPSTEASNNAMMPIASVFHILDGEFRINQSAARVTTNNSTNTANIVSQYRNVLMFLSFVMHVNRMLSRSQRVELDWVSESMAARVFNSAIFVVRRMQQFEHNAQLLQQQSEEESHINQASNDSMSIVMQSMILRMSPAPIDPIIATPRQYLRGLIFSAFSMGMNTILSQHDEAAINTTDVAEQEQIHFGIG